MKEIVASGKFKKDLKRYRGKPETLRKLYEGLNLPKHYKPHMLVGEYSGHMECHIENDTLLIWLDKTANIIKLVRFGTHSELFR